jgi:cytoplasmic iron level regulating protein YaaA (DUF328/UPF0246 family)
MMILLSPSKNLHNIPKPAPRYSLPRMPEQSGILIESLRKLSPVKLQKLMDINDQLARLNYSRYQHYQWPHTTENATAAIYTFRGEVYQGFDANTMTAAQAEMADQRVRILSGLYGILRPLDLIQPYRLEMGTELKVGKAKNLYAFWGERITDLLKEDITTAKAKEVINLASQEYMAAVDVGSLPVPVIDIQFLEDRNGKLQFLSYNAKRSRGWLARYIVDNTIKKSADLKGYLEHEYHYREDLSGPRKMVFVR